MKKEEDWVYQYPSTAVNVKVIGNGDPSPYYGQANKLLYQLKNLMTFNQLGQCLMTRFFNNNVKIVAESLFGQDLITIYVPEEAGIPSCSITLANVPTEVPPMKWWAIGIHPGTSDMEAEVEGEDYFKTYYSIHSSNCESCVEEWSLCDSGNVLMDIGFLSGGHLCNPFRFDETKYDFGDVPNNAARPNDPLDHIVYTLSRGQGEVLLKDQDGGGTYFLWKAYTEWSNMGPWFVTFSKSGLGYMLMEIKIWTTTGIELCHANALIKVDCCLKPENERELRMYWDYPLPYTLVPEFLYGIYQKETFFFIRPEGIMGCPPYEWKLTGPGTLETGVATPANPFLWGAEYTTPDEGFGCRENMRLEVIDRCGSVASTETISCCDSWMYQPVYIMYSILQVSCGGDASFVAMEGCSPMTWTVSGGGSIQVWSDTRKIHYKAPPNNPHCIYNPIITVVDCCGTTDSIRLAINCYTGLALRWCHEIDCVHGCLLDPPPNFCHYHAVQGRRDYDCNNELIDEEYVNYPSSWITALDCSLQDDRPWGCSLPGMPCDSSYMQSCLPVCNMEAGGCGLWDKRTENQLTHGCCPLNPDTGLPYGQ